MLCRVPIVPFHQLQDTCFFPRSPRNQAAVCGSRRQETQQIKKFKQQDIRSIWFPLELEPPLRFPEDLNPGSASAARTALGSRCGPRSHAGWSRQSDRTTSSEASLGQFVRVSPALGIWSTLETLGALGRSARGGRCSPASPSSKRTRFGSRRRAASRCGSAPRSGVAQGGAGPSEDTCGGVSRRATRGEDPGAAHGPPRAPFPRLGRFPPDKRRSARAPRPPCPFRSAPARRRQPRTHRSATLAQP